MRIARQDEVVEPERRVLLDARRNRLRIAYQGRARATAHQSDAGPQVRRNLQVGTRAFGAAGMQRGHAALAFGIHLGEHRLRLDHGRVVDAADERLGRAPGFVVGLADDYMQPNAELDGAALARRASPDVGDLLGDLGRRFAPCQVRVDLLGRELVRRRRRATEPHRRMRLLRRREQQLGALHAQVLAFVVEALPVVAARDDLAPDANELGRLFVARCMVEVHAVAFELGLVAARHEVDKHPPTGEPVEGRGHARGQAGLVQTGAHGDEKLQALGRADQAGSDDPRVFARAAGRDQHALVAEAVRCAGHLLQVVQVDGARAFGRTEVAAVAMGRQEPENLHRHIDSVFTRGWPTRRRAR